MMRRTEARNRRKDTNYRKCYIAFKVTSVPCHKNGSPLSRYVPRAEHHPWDMSIPQAGDNMFEDIGINPPKAVDQKKEEEKTHNETESSNGEIIEGESNSEEDCTRVEATQAIPSAETTGRKLRSQTRHAMSSLPAHTEGNVSQPRNANRAVRNSPSVVIPSPKRKASSQAATMPDKPAPKRKRSATEASINTSDKENEKAAPPAAKRPKKTPSVPAPASAANKQKAPLRRSTRLSSKEV